jgi:hypothetical protein
MGQQYKTRTVSAGLGKALRSLGLDVIGDQSLMRSPGPNRCGLICVGLYAIIARHGSVLFLSQERSG